MRLITLDHATYMQYLLTSYIMTWPLSQGFSSDSPTHLAYPLCNIYYLISMKEA